MTFLDLVGKKAKALGLTVNEICLEANLPPATFCRRAGYTGGLTLDELMRLDIVLGFTDAEKLGILKREIR